MVWVWYMYTDHRLMWPLLLIFYYFRLDVTSKDVMLILFQGKQIVMYITG